MYDRPDHFEIKCNSVLFTIVSYLKYGVPAYEAFDEHTGVFYLIARLYTTVFGTLLVPLVALYTGKLFSFLKEINRKLIQVLSAFFIAFFQIFVEHSSYATPDIVLAFFVVLFAYEMACYIDDGKRCHLVVSILSIGIGITTKYTAAILVIPYASIVIYRCIRIDRKISEVFRIAAKSVVLLLFVVFVIAPNLFTDYNTVIKNFIEEARPNHLGADGLGFWGNLRFYLNSCMLCGDFFTILLFSLGLVALLIYRNRNNLSLVTGLCYWICMSVVPLHWTRWGIPIYIFYFIIMSFGIVSSLNFIHDHFDKRVLSICAQCLCRFVVVLVMLNMVITSIAFTKMKSLPNSRILAMTYTQENEVTKDNSLYEGYTPLHTICCYPPLTAFEVTDEAVTIKSEYADKKYYVMSDSFVNRFRYEPDRYVDECRIYDMLETNYEVVYFNNPDGNYAVNDNIFQNIYYSFKYILGNQTSSGDSITIYQLNS